MFATDETLKAKKGMAWLIALAALMALIAIGLAVAFAINSASELHSFAAQDDKEAIEAASSSKPTVTNATTQVINLAGLMSLSAEDAVQKIGHGAAVQDEAPNEFCRLHERRDCCAHRRKGRRSFWHAYRYFRF